MRDREAKRFNKYPYGPFRFRLVSAILCVLTGVLFSALTVGRLGQPADHSALVLFLGGITLIIVGVAGFFIARWMAKRNL